MPAWNLAVRRLPPAALAAVSLAVRGAVTPPSEISVPPGFRVELVREAGAQEGSWVSLAVDDQGRFYLSPQEAIPNSGFARESGWGGLWRATLAADGKLAAWDQVPCPVGGAMGLLWAYQSLYVNGRGPDGHGVYRLRDADGDGNLESWSLLKKIPGGGGEHGAHGMALGPDGRIRLVHGNSTPLIEGLSPASPFRHWAEDSLLPRLQDPVATFFDNLKAPYGHVLRTNEDGSEWELVAAGFRNPYDLAFHPSGALFTFDSDMEWDVGLPWYRPTRILQVVEGGEYGFREGTDKWPEAYPDSLPAALDVGLASPTGLQFGTRSNFPGAFREALYALDWTFGRILMIDLRDRGGAFGGAARVFLQGKGLPVTDVEFAPDGAMLFTVGGRGTQAALYRVSWTGGQAAPPLPEAFASGSPDPARFRDFARMRRLEGPDPEEKTPTPPPPGVALLAAARARGKDQQAGVLAEALDGRGVDPATRLRVLTLSLARHGRPDDALTERIRDALFAEFPRPDFALNRQLAELLVFLDHPGAVEPLLAAMEAAPDPAQQIAYARALCEAPGERWSPGQRRRYFAWFRRAAAYRGGNSFAGFIGKIGDRALERVPPAEREALAALRQPEPPAPPVIVPRAFQKAYAMADMDALLARPAGPRNLARGKEIYTSVQCAACHKFRGEGGDAGPDLTAVAGRFQRRDILEAVIDPSKAISEQYVTWTMSWRGGKSATGMIVEDNNDRFTLLTDPVARTTTPVPKFLLEKKEPSPVSLMPPMLLSVLTEDEILDLLAYLDSGLEP